MIRKLYLLTIIVLLFFSCSSESSSEVEPISSDDDPIAEQDTTPPVISVSDFGSNIEILTQVDISITDNSDNITTRIFIDDIEVLSSQEKQFVFELDPYNFSSGEKTMRVVSQDDSENETTETILFDLARLLFRLTDAQNRISDSFQDYYLALNSQDGDLIASTKLETNDELSFFAEDDFERQDIIASLYIIFSNPNTIPRGFVLSFDDIPAGSSTLSSAELDEAFNFIKRSDNFQFEMMDAGVDTEFYMNGKDVELISSFNFAQGNFSESGRYNPSSTVPAFMYSSPQNVNELNAYQYLFIDGLNENNSASFNDFLPLQEINQINIPDAVSDFSFELRAYNDQTGFDLGEYSTVLRFTGNKDDENGILNVPQLNEFDIYQQHFVANITPNIGWNGFFTGLGTPVLPTWTAELQGTEVFASGDYDIAQLVAIFTGTNTLTWIYNAENKSSYENPFENLILPGEVEMILNDIQIDTSRFDEITFYRADLFEYEEEFDITEGMFSGLPFLNAKGDQQVLGFTLIQN